MLVPLVLVLLLVLLSNGDRPEPELPPLTARDGILEFTVDALRCGQSEVGARRAQGQLCTVRLRVSNFGTSARRVDVGSQTLYDGAGRAYDADRTAWTYLPESAPFFRQEINPGNELTATLVFDVAADAEPERLEVHDSPFSGGASITL
ncbi:MAG TPA: DUF4352 domain-containing protein [Pseudonocardiaceae bacterium]